MRRVRVDNNPPSDWVAEAEALTQKLREAANEEERKQIIDENKTFWRDKRIHDWLLKQFHNKCWYSEAADCVSPDHVDHFRPKGRIRDEDTNETEEGYWWLAFDWKNYRISGHLINSKKSDLFPISSGVRCRLDDEGSRRIENHILIDPSKEEDETRLISFDVDEDSCRAVPAGGSDSFDLKRAEDTIRIIGLNRLDLLNQKRFAIWNRAKNKISDYESANASQGAQALALVQKTAARNELREMVSYEAEFSSVAEACIRKNAPEPLIASVFEC